MIALTMLAESNCRAPSSRQDTPVTGRTRRPRGAPARPRSAPWMSADSRAASARCAAGAAQIPARPRRPTMTRGRLRTPRSPSSPSAVRGPSRPSAVRRPELRGGHCLARSRALIPAALIPAASAAARPAGHDAAGPSPARKSGMRCACRSSRAPIAPASWRPREGARVQIAVRIQAQRNQRAAKLSDHDSERARVARQCPDSRRLRADDGFRRRHPGRRRARPRRRDRAIGRDLDVPWRGGDRRGRQDRGARPRRHALAHVEHAAARPVRRAADRGPDRRGYFVTCVALGRHFLPGTPTRARGSRRGGDRRRDHHGARLVAQHPRPRLGRGRPAGAAGVRAAGPLFLRLRNRSSERQADGARRPGPAAAAWPAYGAGGRIHLGMAWRGTGGSNPAMRVAPALYREEIEAAREPRPAGLRARVRPGAPPRARWRPTPPRACSAPTCSWCT